MNSVQQQREKKMASTLHKNLYNWKLTLLIFISLTVVIIFKLYIPFGISVYKRSKQFYEQYQLRNNSNQLTLELGSIRKDIYMIDSLLAYQEKRKIGNTSNIVDVLYSFADSSQFKTSKVETSEQLSVLNHTEMPVNVKGTGSYRAAGKFVESIENASWSTRIRQVLMKEDKNGDIEMHVDFVVIE